MGIRSSGQVVNALSIDVEDYFQVSALSPHFPSDRWDQQECRVERNVEKILGLLSEAGVSATFFTLGWIAERYPHLVKRIASERHEVASHGCDHRRVSELDPTSFGKDITRSKALLEDLTGQRVLGYRAPSFSIGNQNSWAFDCLQEAGYRYSSSVYPIRHDHYGVPSAPRFPFETRAGLLEIPLSTIQWARINFPAGGGGYFRLLPYVVSSWLIRSINRTDGRSTVFYFHPWELDPGQPIVRGLGTRTRVRHYVNLKRTESRLRRLLADFEWNRMDQVFL
ncbi:MAG: XrtA system polysaccharide deacetylase [Burkholderiales bacterium]